MFLKSDPENAFNILLNRLYSLLKKTSNSGLKDLFSSVINILEHSQDIGMALDTIKRYVSMLPDNLLADVRKDIYDITKDLYKIGFNLVKLENKGINIAFNLTDIDAINAIGKHNIFWVGESFKELGDEINNLVEEFYRENLTRQQLAERLKERLGIKIRDLERYYEGLADHIATKTKELGRISGYQRAGIKYVKVKAILDDRTSQICRHMHGRIISVERLVEQRERILSAKSKDELMSAQKWITSFTGKTKDLPDGVAGPPYHYRCRTTTVAYFEELQGESLGNENYQYFDGNKTRKEKVIYRHYDRELGREIVLTDGVMDHILAPRHNIQDIDKVKASIRGIKRWGVSIHPQSAGQMVALSENGVFIIFRDNVVYNMYIDDRGKKVTERYFKKYTEGRLKKWVGLLKQFFTVHLTR